MATAKDGSLTFDTKFSTAEFEKGVKSIETLLGKVAVNLVGKMGQAGRETEKTVSTAAAGAAKEAGKSVASASSLITGFLKNDLITAGVSFMLDFVDQGIGMASQMQMVQQQVNATFGKEAGTLNGWAQDASNSYGLSEQAAKGYANEVGKTLKKAAKSDKDVAKMSKGIVGLSVDMASFYQLDHKEVLTALEKAVSGDAAALDKMGISMGDTELQAFALSEGITKSYGEMSEAEKVALRYDYVMAQTAQAQGAFAESSGTHSSQMQIFQANVQNLATGLGNVLLPAVNWALTGLNSLFAGPPRNELYDSITTAGEKLDGVKGQLDTLKQDYTATAVSINVNYNSAQTLIDELETITSKAITSEEDATRIQTITETLLKMYPELEEYVGIDGALTIEMDTVRSLTEQYKNLALAKAASEYVAKVRGNYEGALFDHEMLKQTVLNIETQNEELEKSNKKWEGLEDAAAKASGKMIESLNLEGASNIDEVNASLDVLRTYLEYVGGDTKELAEAGYDITQILGLNGLPKSAEEILASADAVSELQGIVGDVCIQSGIKISSNTAEIERNNVAIKEAQKLVDEHGQTVDSAKKDWENGEATLKRLKEALEGQGEAAKDNCDLAAATAENEKRAFEERAASYARAGEALARYNRETQDAMNDTGLSIAEVQASRDEVAGLAADIQTALDAGKTAQQALFDAKTQVTDDAKTILDQMNQYVIDLGTYVTAMKDAMVKTIGDAELEAATAGNAFAQGAGDGYRANTALRDAVGASAQQSLAALNSYANAFETAGSGLVGSIASGVTGNASALSDAVRDAVRGALAAAQSAFSGNSVFRTASRYYPHRTGLEYVPYDEYPALLHKGESVLTASEAALWRGGLYVREPGAARVDYDALAAAIWRGAPPEGGLAISVNLDGEEVANVLEPSISALQGRRLALQRR